MSDQGITVTPEDRERLAKSKYAEWFDELFEERFEKAFEKKSASRKPPAPATGQATPETPLPHTEPPRRKRSLLETCLTDTFGF